MRKFLMGATVVAVTLLFVSVSVRAQTTADPVGAFNKSLSYETQGKFAEALAEMEPLVRMADTDYLISLRFGWINYLVGHYEASEKYYTQAERLAKHQSIEAMLGHTLPLAALGKWQEVEQIYQRILKLDPVHYTANLRLGQIYLHRGDYAAATRYLTAARSYYPAEYEANLSSGWNELYLGNHDDARTLFTRALMLSPGDTSATRGLGLAK